MMAYKKNKRNFEITGFVNPKTSYYVQLENVYNEDKDDLKTMVDKNRYFTIFAPRQSGKTTFFRAFFRDLEKDPTYIFILLSFDNFSNLSMEEFYTSIENEIYPQLIQRLRAIDCPCFDSVKNYLESHRISNSLSFLTLFRKLNQLIKFKKLIVFIDEFDGIPKHEIVDFLSSLRKLYQEYKEINDKALYSVGIIGIRNAAKLSFGNVTTMLLEIQLERIQGIYTGEERMHMILLIKIFW